MASKEAYSIACIELFGRLWVELEQVPVAATSGTRAQVLRLELVLLLDACGSDRWRLHLDNSQRLTLQSTLAEVLGALNSSSDIVPRDAVAWAQNCLLDAMIEHCEAYLPPAARSCVASTQQRLVLWRGECQNIQPA
jgi:hypothetical protein